jgi:hypothetical protein
VAFVLAAERLGWWHTEPVEEWPEETDEEAPDTDA